MISLVAEHPTPYLPQTAPMEWFQAFAPNEVKTLKPWNEDVQEIRVLWTVAPVSPCVRENDILWLVHDMLNWVVVHCDSILGREFPTTCVEQGIEIFLERDPCLFRALWTLSTALNFPSTSMLCKSFAQVRETIFLYLGKDSCKLLRLWIFSLSSTPKQMLFGLTREEIVCTAVEQRPTLVPQAPE